MQSAGESELINEDVRYPSHWMLDFLNYRHFDRVREEKLVGIAYLLVRFQPKLSCERLGLKLSNQRERLS